MQLLAAILCQQQPNPHLTTRLWPPGLNTQRLSSSSFFFYCSAHTQDPQRDCFGPGLYSQPFLRRDTASALSQMAISCYYAQMAHTATNNTAINEWALTSCPLQIYGRMMPLTSAPVLPICQAKVAVAAINAVCRLCAQSHPGLRPVQAGLSCLQHGAEQIGMTESALSRQVSACWQCRHC